MWTTVKEWLVWAWDMWPVLKEVLPALGVGGALIVGIEFAKWCDLFNGSFWSKLQLAILVCTLLAMCWNGYWVLHPSKQEVQWQRGTDDYGLN
ncbi:hypothetical protein GPK29_22585 [Aeromonas hydrophila]|uniref:hypothetical protein n=1 Tax=Aeromonas TaxID=642 RepID=UPI0015DCEC79|nr:MULTISPECIES: hypothetical protein [Aeromonas]MBW3798985.1 hypothetical protein [Aeromonas hydrophila]MBW3803777.1 hypothetical protein [Aeromonas hydrophila]MBW3821759.1 hypothetical protein [Aeromonas hydrophila]BBT68669.1 hypothetical protein WP8S18E04_P10190 [Aeromonas caviae]